ncbi:MAG: putative DNA-binding transcriptional regulator YafY, partial [Kiritimatiellia bacterium]
TYRQGLYLFGFDVPGGQVKTYALERFVDMQRVRGDRFEVPIGWQPRAHIAHAFGIISGTPQHCTIAFSPNVTGYIRERVWHPTQTFATRADGWLVLGLQVGVTVELVNWVCSFGRDAHALGPDKLRERVLGTLQGAVENYR